MSRPWPIYWMMLVEGGSPRGDESLTWTGSIRPVVFGQGSSCFRLRGGLKPNASSRSWGVRRGGRGDAERPCRLTLDCPECLWMALCQFRFGAAGSRRQARGQAPRPLWESDLKCTSGWTVKGRPEGCSRPLASGRRFSGARV